MVCYRIPAASRTMYLGLLGASSKNILQFLSNPLTGVVYRGCSFLAHVLTAVSLALSC